LIIFIRKLFVFQTIAEIESKIEFIIGKLIQMENCSTLITQLLDNNIVDCQQIIAEIHNVIDNLENEANQIYLAQLLANDCVKKSDLSWLEKVVKEPHSSIVKKKFLIKLLSEIGKHICSH
jgi:hypothetical protein